MAADLKTVESAYKALADATRLRILALLVEGEVCVCEIHDSLRSAAADGVEAPGVSAAQRAWSKPRRDATWMHYRLADVDPVIKGIVQNAAHAMSHVTTAGRDRQRFEKCCGRTLTVVDAPHAPCCAS